MTLSRGVDCLRAICSSDLITEDPEAWEGFLLTLVLGDVNQRPWGDGLCLGRAEHLLVGLELELESAVTVCKQLVLGLCGPQLLLRCLVLLLQVGD